MAKKKPPIPVDMDLHGTLEKILKRDDRLVGADGSLLKNKVVESSMKMEEWLIRILLSHKGVKAAFFTVVGKVMVFDVLRFQRFVMSKEFLPDSYTSYKNKVGLVDDDGYLSDRQSAVLAWPYKDCVLEGGQTKEDVGRSEIFWSEVLAPDRISRLTSPKVLSNFKRFDKRGCVKVGEIHDKDNLIIKGNNLLALHTLEKRFEGKIKLIYIDPPYNTGSDSFRYNDRFPRSTWLTFMKNRLDIARRLLRDDGVIFVQCDDNEQAYLKVLMDEIFGPDNFINVISAKMKNIAGASGGGEDKRLKKNIEYITIFARDYNRANLKKIHERTELSKLVQSYKASGVSWKYTSAVVDFGDKEYFKSALDGRGDEIKIFKVSGVKIKSIARLAKDEGISEKDVYLKYIDRIFMTTLPQSSIRTRVVDALDGDDHDFYSIVYTPKSGKNKGVPYEQFYKGSGPKMRLLAWLKDVAEVKDGNVYKKEQVGTLWQGFDLNNLSKEGDSVFESGKKPEELVRRILEISTEPGDIVLDYHLGSGTTAAVAHKMGRQYVGIEQMDYIETLAVERIKKVIAGEQSGVSGEVSWSGGGSFVYCELAKANQRFIDAIKSAGSKKLSSIWVDMQKNAFLSYKVDLGRIDLSAEGFGALSIEEQKSFLIETLDKKMLYIPCDEINDSDHKIGKADKELNRQFHRNKVGGK